jgi:ankyrin repeat protein
MSWSHAYAIGSPWGQEALNKTLRHEVIEGAAVAKIKRLIQLGAGINSKAAYGETPLEYAIRFGRYKAALKLIEWGADPNSENDSGMTPLHWAAREPNASRIVEALLLAGADVNRRDFSGRTPLMFAAQGDCIRTVAVILTRAKDTVDIDAQSDHQETALTLARDGAVLQMLEMARKRQRGELNWSWSAP